MKKIICVIGILCTLTLAGCGCQSNNAKDDAQPTMNEKIVKEVENSGANPEVTAVPDNDMTAAIKKVNSGAIINESLDNGLKMVSIVLPIDSDVATTFVSQVENIVKNCDFEKDTTYNYYHFSTKDGDDVLVYAAFKNDGSAFTLDSVKAVDTKYESELEKAISGKALFTKAE